MATKVGSSTEQQTSYSARERQLEEIELANKLVKQAQKDGEQKVEQLRDHYNEEAVRTEIQGQERVLYERDKGYESLRKMQSSQNQALHNMTREAEKQQSQTQQLNQAESSQTDRDANAKLNEAKKQNLALMEMENRRAQNQREAFKQEQLMHYEMMAKEKDAKLEQTTTSQKKSLDEIQERAAQNTLAAETKYQGLYQKTLQDQATALGQTDKKAAESLQSLQASHTRKLGAYSNRASDPFYQMVDLKPVVSESESSYTVRVKAPLHEQNALQLTVTGDQLVLSGSRRNFERLNGVEAGSFKETSAYQTFRETFPIVAPVNAKGISKEVSGDQVTFTIPKKTSANLSPRATIKPEPLKADRPQYPAGIAEIPPSPKSKDKPLS